MAFTFISGPQHIREEGVLASAAMVKGSHCRWDVGTGYLEPAVESAVTKAGVCLQTKTAGATSGDDKVAFIPFERGQIWLADSTGTPTQTMRGTTCAMTDAAVLNEDETSTRAIFDIVGFRGALADKKIYVMPRMEAITSVGV